MGRYLQKKYRDIIIESLKYCQKHKGLEIHAFVIMLNHIHLLARSSKESLSDTIRDFKRHKSKQVDRAIEETEESRRK